MQLNLRDSLIEDYLDKNDSNYREASSFAVDTLVNLTSEEADWDDFNSIFDFPDEIDD